MNMKQSRFFETVKLLLEILPEISTEENLALKGGTAINLILQDMPRLSVDIDLCYMPIEPRDASLKKVAQSLERIGRSLKTKHKFLIQASPAVGTQNIAKMMVGNHKAKVKIEVNPVIRGSIFPTEIGRLAPSAESLFEKEVEVRVLSRIDLYGSKLCAAMDRQHPRDLFDVKWLFDQEGITQEIRQAFLVYLISHGRPMHEILNPRLKDISEIYHAEFNEMTLKPVSLESLVSTRKLLIETLNADLSDKEKAFLVSVNKATPDFGLLELKGIEKLPGVQWKVQNLKKMELKKRDQQLKQLMEILGI